MSAKRSLPRNLYIGRVRVQEGENNETELRWQAYATCGIGGFWWFRAQLLRQCSVWAFRDIYILPWEGEK